MVPFMQSQRGFSVIEYILVVAVLALIGGGVWFALEQRKEATKPSEPVAKTVQETTRCDKDWKEFSDPRTKASFCYPTEWKNTITAEGEVRRGTIESPSGSVQLEYSNEIAGLGGGPLCGDNPELTDCVKTQVYTVTPLKDAAGVSYIETVETWNERPKASAIVASFGLVSTKDGFLGVQSSADKAAPVVKTYNSAVFYKILTHTNMGGYFSSNFSPGGGANPKVFGDYTQAYNYFSDPDVKTAKRILTSYNLP